MRSGAISRSTSRPSGTTRKRSWAISFASFRDLAGDANTPLDLESLLPEEFRNTSWEQYARVTADEREPLLLAASKLGIELVSDDASDEFDES